MSIAQFFKQRRLIAAAKKLRAKCEGLSTSESMVDTVLACRKFSLVQKRTEILKLTQLLQKLKPKTICDIGSSGGGTLRLFCQYAVENARILSIDINNMAIRQAAHPHLARPQQEITVLNADSHVAETIDYAKKWLNNETFDFIFIDGDHSYDGVGQDFRFYL